MKWFRRRDQRNPSGPYDASVAPDDGLHRIDLGSVRVPVADGVQIQLEMSPDRTEVRAVHLLTDLGQFTISAFAAPPASGLWPEISAELVNDMPPMHSVRTEPGEWGQEVVGEMDEAVFRIVGIDGPGWLLRGVSAAPPRSSGKAAAALRDTLRRTIVVRGHENLPVRTPLPITLPDEIARNL
ncbi:DUF3710 domain-containing protein [Kibdelosporangium philippinense]|uniref:DUF3710 domain-containing protein n=1 Tax=Kibdelosporangium philippinense TaxID=211113 RepID=A0ABS8ZBY1_9PSEU|nr:DUF3710 domain-containing protein [Kibdelosporangium philippinense]MCE7003327.1 DUF3710 domain-containing protein [Kibdelosporangium philippinense]